MHVYILLDSCTLQAHDRRMRERIVMLLALPVDLKKADHKSVLLNCIYPVTLQHTHKRRENITVGCYFLFKRGLYWEEG